MTYFCTKCQKRHPVTDISADLWSIVRDDVTMELDELSIRLQQQAKEKNGDEIADFFDALIRFINDAESIPVDTSAFYGEKSVNAFFPLNATNIRQLQNIGKSGRTISGTYVITLQQLFDLYSRHAPGRSERLVEAARKHISGEWMQSPVCQQRITAFFDTNYVLDKVTDQNDVPFDIHGRMLGFRRICPHCGRELSRAAGRAEEIVVALSGSPRAGKSSCMVAMANSLLQNGHTYGLSIVPMSHDNQWEQLSQEMETYRKCGKITKTPDTQRIVPSHSMLIRLKDARATERVLTIVDMPGEFWQSGRGLTAEFFQQYSGIFENIDCIWFVVSKATVRMSQSNIPDAIRQVLADNTSEDVEVIRNANPMNVGINFGMLKDQLASSMQKAMPPTMIIVSKPDFVVGPADREETRKYQLFPDSSEDISGCNARETASALKMDRERLYGIREAPMFAHSRNVRTFIDKVNPTLLAAVEDNCHNRFYASLSPYGRPAREGTEGYEVPTPYHELFPLLWTLSVTGALRVYHPCSWQKLNWLHAIVRTENTEEAVQYDYRTPTESVSRSRQQQDVALLRADVCRNLFMQTARHITTVIDHERG